MTLSFSSSGGYSRHDENFMRGHLGNENHGLFIDQV